MSDPPAGTLAVWVLAARPKTLWAAVAPVAVGTACAWSAGGLRPGPALAALLGALLIQIGTNYANDLFDAEKGADTAERAGPTRAVQAGLLSPAQVRRGMWLVFAASLVPGLYLTWVAGPAVVAIGLVSIAAGIAYTGGPYPLGYHGLGDLFVMLFFGFVAVGGTAWVQMLEVPTIAWWAAVPMGALATAVLAVNNIRDLESDEKAGKRTLAVRLGRRAAQGEFLLLLAAAYGVPIGLVASAGPWILLPLLTLPLAVALVRQLLRWQGEALNRTLAGTARLLLLYALLFSVGLVLG